MKSDEQQFDYTQKKFRYRDKISITVHDIEMHRNGVSGEGFFAITFSDDSKEMKGNRFIGIVFSNLLAQDKDGYFTLGLIHKNFSDEGWINPQVAILEIGMLNKGNIGDANKWRGDHYLPVLADAIVDREKKLAKFNSRMYDEDAKSRGGF